jgi:hypothetical protein
MKSSFAVVLEEHVSLGAEALAPMFERALGMLRPDAVRAADRAGPFVAEGIPAGQAEALRGELAGAGVVAHVVPSEKLVSARSPESVRTVRIADDALHATLGNTGPVVHLEWNRIILLCAAEVADSEHVPPKHLDADAMTRAKERDSQREYDVRLADIIARCDDQLIHFRLRSRNLNYELILGPECSRDLHKDFPEVLAQIGERADRAFVTPGYRAACLRPDGAGVDESEWQFDDEKSFDVYTRWRLQMIVLGIGVDAGAASPGEGFRPATPPVEAGAGRLVAGVVGGLGARSLVGSPPTASLHAAQDAVSLRERQMIEFSRRAQLNFAIFGKVLRGIVAAAFAALLIWSWLVPDGLAPYILLGFALGDLTAMVFVVISPGFAETLKEYHPDGLVIEVLTFIFLAGYFGSGWSLGGDAIRQGTGIFIVMAAAGGGFFARLLAALARDAATEV